MSKAPTAAVVAYQRAKSCRTEDLVREAMRAMESEAANPDPDGPPPRFSRKELCRRAEIGLSTLKNPSHVALLAEVMAWLERMSRKHVPAEFDSAKPALHGNRPLSREQEFKALAVNYAAAMINNEELRRRVFLLEAEVKGLASS